VFYPISVKPARLPATDKAHFRWWSSAGEIPVDTTGWQGLRVRARYIAV